MARRAKRDGSGSGGGAVSGIDARVRVGSIELRSPVMTASGTAGYGTELDSAFDLASIGAVVTKSLAAFAWDGNPAPRLHPTAQGMLNTVGLQGPGVGYWLEHVVPALEASGATVIASIWGRSIDDYRAAADLLVAAPSCVVAVEVNLSCPNLEGRRSIFAHDPELSAEVVAATVGCGRPRWAKLERQHRPDRRGRRGGRDAGAEAVTCINTMLGFAYDPETLRAGARRGWGRAVRTGDPSDRGAGGARRPRRAPRAAHRRRRGSDVGVGCGRDVARRRASWRCRSARPCSPIRPRR